MLAPELVKLSGDDKNVELRIIPNDHGPITVENLLELIKDPNFRKLCPMMPVIEKAVAEVNKSVDTEEGKTELFYLLAERKDAQIEIIISKDKMTAEAKLTAAWGGKSISMPDILKALKANRISMGLKKKRLEKLLKYYLRLKPGEECKTIIAAGKKPTPGENAIIERKVPLARERMLIPQEKEGGKVDMRELGSVIMVKPNDVLMRKTPATEGTHGYDIHGQKLAAKPGKDADFTPGDGTERSSTNPNELIATAPGQPVETAKGMQVDDVLQIKDVDVGYGNVNFKGSVLITGDVHEGMNVKSSGDITVMGFVDSAQLEADGDVIVNKGIIGRQAQGEEHQVTTSIKAKGQICAQFVQYSALEADGEVLVTKQLLHSHTITHASLTVADPSNRRGDLIGGTVRADKGVKAVVIGATAGTKTDIYCAMQQGEMKEHLRELGDSVKSIVLAGLDLSARLKKLPPKAEWENDFVMVEQVKMMLEEKHQLIAEKNREEDEYNQLKKDVINYYKDHSIQAIKNVFPNAEIHIGEAAHKTNREHGPCTIQNENKEIKFDYGNKGNNEKPEKNGDDNKEKDKNNE